MHATTELPMTAARSAPRPSAAAGVAPRQRVLGGAFIAAPLLLMASSTTGTDTAGGVLAFYAFAGFALVVLTLTQALAVPFPRAASVLTVAGVLGVAAGFTFAIDGIHSELPNGVYLIDEGGIAAVLVANVPGLMVPLSWIGIGVALLRAGVQPRFSGAVLIIAGALFGVSRIGDIAPLMIADDALFLLALAPLGWAILQGRELFAGRSASAG